MIPQISSGKNALGCLKYQEKDQYKRPSKENGEEESNEKVLSKLIYTTNFIGSLGREPQDTGDINKGFRQWNLRNSAVKQNVFHASLNFPKYDDDKLHESKLIEIANNFMEQMGYEGIPYAIYEHFDTDHKHIHIVASRVNVDGKRVNDFQEMRRAIEISRALEETYGLWRVSSQEQGNDPNRADKLKNLNALTDSVSQKSYIRNQLKEALRVEKFESLQALQSHLKSKKIQMNVNEKQGKKFLSFFVHTENEQSKIFFGSAIQKNLWTDIEKKLNRNRKETLSERHQSSIQAFRNELKTIKKLESLQQLERILKKYDLTLDIQKNYLKSYQRHQYIFKALQQKRQAVNSLVKRGELAFNADRRKTHIKTLFLTKYLKDYVENPHFHSAKKLGNMESAEKLIDDYFNKESLRSLKSLNDIQVISIRDTNSPNVIPEALAKKLCQTMNWENGSQNFQLEHKITFTNSSLWKRILFKPTTIGQVISGQKYIICDDVSTTGSTLKSYINHIEKGGGEVAAVMTIATRNDMDFNTNHDLLARLETKFGKLNFDKFLMDFSIGSNAEDLTNLELAYFLEQFNSLDELYERATEQYQILSRQLIDKCDQKVYEKLIKRTINADFNLEFTFHSMNQKGKIIYSDTVYQRQHRSLLQKEIIERCQFLIEDERHQIQFEETSNNQKRLFNAMKKTMETKKSPITIEWFINELNARGLNYRLNYERGIDKKLQIQKIEVFSENRDCGITLKFNEIFKSQSTYASLFYALNEDLQRMEASQGIHVVREYIRGINEQSSIENRELTPMLNYLESMPYKEYKENIALLGHMISEPIFNHLPQHFQNAFVLFKRQEQGRAASIMHQGKALSKLTDAIIHSNDYYLSNFSSEILDEKTIFDEK